MTVPAPARESAHAAADRGAGGSRGDRVAGTIVGLIGLLCVGAGLIVMLGWFCRSPLLRWPGTDNPMVFSAALCLTATGVALAVLSRGWHAVVTVVAGLNVTLAALMLLSEALHVEIGLDDLFVKTYLGASVGAWASTPGCASSWSASACWPLPRGGRGRDSVRRSPVRPDR